MVLLLFLFLVRLSEVEKVKVSLIMHWCMIRFKFVGQPLRILLSEPFSLLLQVWNCLRVVHFQINCRLLMLGPLLIYQLPLVNNWIFINELIFHSKSQKK